MIGAIRIHPKAVGKLLNLPPLVYAVAGLCLGYPAKDQQQKPRLPLETILHHERYPEDDQQINHIKRYDQTMVEFYSSQAMHDKDPRWSKVMAAELPVFMNAQSWMNTFSSEFSLQIFAAIVFLEIL